MGNEVHAAHDGVQAVEAAEQLRPNVVLMDVCWLVRHLHPVHPTSFAHWASRLTHSVQRLMANGNGIPYTQPRSPR
jgi:hypothetical protein